MLASEYANPTRFRDGLPYFPAPEASGLRGAVLTSGHVTLLGLVHAEALHAALSAVPTCTGRGQVPLLPTPKEIGGVLANITAALAGPSVWSEDEGMYVPCSGNCATLVDVWGSALAVELGLAPAERSARIVRWFGEHWAEVVQGGQVRMLPALSVEGPGGGPAGQFWPSASTPIEPGTHVNGGSVDSLCHACSFRVYSFLL